MSVNIDIACHYATFIDYFAYLRPLRLSSPFIISPFAIIASALHFA